jgi:hypothetical protein
MFMDFRWGVRPMPRSLMDGVGRFFGWWSTGMDGTPDHPSNWSHRREATRIGVAVAIEAPRPGPHGVTIFARRLGSSVPGFDYQVQFLSDGPVRFLFVAPPSPGARKVMRYMNFRPEDLRNKAWVRKSGWHWSAKDLVDTINFVHLVIHHGYVIPDQQSDDPDG